MAAASGGRHRPSAAAAATAYAPASAAIDNPCTAPDELY
jgi:hypothetical protein